MDIPPDKQDLVYPGPPVPAEWKIVANLRLKDPSASLRVISAAIGFSEQAVRFWTKKPDYQRYENWLVNQVLPDLPPSERIEREQAHTRIKEKIETHAEDMLDRLLIILETTPDVRVQKEIATDWLDRAGYSAPKTTSKSGLVMVLSEDVMAGFFERAHEAGLLQRPVKAVEGEVVDGHPL